MSELRKCTRCGSHAPFSLVVTVAAEKTGVKPIRTAQSKVIRICRDCLGTIGCAEHLRRAAWDTMEAIR